MKTQHVEFLPSVYSRAATTFSLGDSDFLTVGKRASAYVDLLVCGVLPKSTSVGMSIPYLLDWMKCVGLLVSMCVCECLCKCSPPFYAKYNINRCRFATTMP